jgi:hypothetical protein
MKEIKVQRIVKLERMQKLEKKNMCTRSFYKAAKIAKGIGKTSWRTDV